MKKKILFVGASFAQVPPIKYAKKMGYYVISCDQKKNSPGFKYSDKSYVVSTTNKKKILGFGISNFKFLIYFPTIL